MWQVLSREIQDLPHGLLLAGLQFGCAASAGLLLKQALMNCCRAEPVIPAAFVLHSFMSCCCGVSAAKLGPAANAAIVLGTINTKRERRMFVSL